MLLISTLSAFHRSTLAKKYYKGTKIGQYSCNPLGKNPGDVWVIPNVKHNHAEKTAHPCQFPVELIERLALR
jgi:adenine-specific DNA-methyltransferase